MRQPLKNRPAFTFIELTIVVVILAILSVALAVSYQRIQLKVRFDANVDKITSIFQQARSYSLSTLMIDGTEPTTEYVLTMEDTNITLQAVGSSTTETLAQFFYDSDISANTTLEVFYTPPYGEICLQSTSCPTEPVTVILSDSTGTYSTSFTITANSGYVEVEQLLPL